MKKLLSHLRQKLGGSSYDDLESEQGYLELDTATESKNKILIRPFLIEDFEDIKGVLDVLREGHTIALINIRPLKDRDDRAELVRAINKIKKTIDALQGEIAGFGEDYLVATPPFATIYRAKQTKEVKKSDE